MIDQYLHGKKVIISRPYLCKKFHRGFKRHRNKKWSQRYYTTYFKDVIEDGQVIDAPQGWVMTIKTWNELKGAL